MLLSSERARRARLSQAISSNDDIDGTATGSGAECSGRSEFEGGKSLWLESYRELVSNGTPIQQSSLPGLIARVPRQM